MTCDAVLPLLRDYVDRELDAAGVEAVEGHLAECQSCGARVQAENDLKQTIRSRARTGPAPAVLAAQVLRRLREEEARKSRPLWSRRHLVLGTGVLLLLALAVLLWHDGGRSRLVTELIDDHIRYLVSTVAAEEGTGDPLAAERWLEDQLNLAVPVPRFAPEGPRLLGARRCYVLDRQVALIFYELDGQRVSVFVMDDRNLDLAGMTRLDVPEAECSMDSYKGYHVVGWTRAGLLFAVVGRGDPQHLIEAVRAALEP